MPLGSVRGDPVLAQVSRLARCGRRVLVACHHRVVRFRLLHAADLVAEPERFPDLGALAGTWTPV